MTEIFKDLPYFFTFFYSNIFLLHYSRPASQSDQDFFPRDAIRYLNITEKIFYATLNYTNPNMVYSFKLFSPVININIIKWFFIQIEISSQTIWQRCAIENGMEIYTCSPHYSTHSNLSKIIVFEYLTNMFYHLFYLVTIVQKANDPDSRDLVFATQTLLKGTEKIILSTSNQSKPRFVNKTKWKMRTHLQKVRLTKDIKNMKME